MLLFQYPQQLRIFHITASSYNAACLHLPFVALFHSWQTWIACRLPLGGLLTMLKLLWGKLWSRQAKSLSWIFFAQCDSLGAASLVTVAGDGCYFCTAECDSSAEKMWPTYLQLQSCVFNSILLVPQNIISPDSLGLLGFLSKILWTKLHKVILAKASFF